MPRWLRGAGVLEVMLGGAGAAALLTISDRSSFVRADASVVLQLVATVSVALAGFVLTPVAIVIALRQRARLAVLMRNHGREFSRTALLSVGGSLVAAAYSAGALAVLPRGSSWVGSVALGALVFQFVAVLRLTNLFRLALAVNQVDEEDPASAYRPLRAS